MDEQSLRVRVRQCIVASRLPCAPGQKTYAGFGDGRCCDICASEIGPRDVQYEVDFVADGVRTRTLIMHFACHTLWHEESQCGRPQHRPDEYIALAGADRD
jgi:hypothetical protein